VTLDEINTEFENIRAAWQRMVEQRNTAELSMAVYPLWYFSDLRGRYHDALALFQQAEDALRPVAGDTEVDRVIGQMLTRQGFFYVSMGKPAEGQAHAQEGLSILQRAGSPEDVILAYDSLCLTSIYIFDPVAMKQAAEQAVRVAKRCDDRWLLARALYFVACANLNLGNLEETGRIAPECLELAELCGDLWLRALTLRDTLGGVAMRQGDYTEAKRWQEQSLHLLEQVGQACMIAETHRELAFTLCRMNKYPQSVYHYQQCFKILADTGGYSYLEISALLYIADLCLVQGHEERTIEFLVLILHHSETLQWQRVSAEQKLRQIQSEVTPHIFARAQERGRKLELRTVIQELLVELSQSAQAVPPTPPLIDPLTERELEILHLIADGLTNREIADQLILAASTIKWYNNQIFTKLNAASRTQAVAQARMLGLLP
jgi:ATP/maltotriose-dependent transcriptional regulator MalT